MVILLDKFDIPDDQSHPVVSIRQESFKTWQSILYMRGTLFTPISTTTNYFDQFFKWRRIIMILSYEHAVGSRTWLTLQWVLGLEWGA